MNKREVISKTKQVVDMLRTLFKNVRLSDLLIFLFFLLISSLFWFIQELDEDFGAEIDVPVKLVGIPHNAHITNDLPSDIGITVQGKGGDLLYFLLSHRTDTLRIQFENKNELESGYKTLQRDTLVTLIKQLLPTGTEITSVSPNIIYYSFITGEPTRLPVCLSDTINTDAHFCVDTIMFIPDSVDVYASRDILKTLNAVYVENVKTSHLAENLDTIISLQKKRDVLIENSKVRLRVVLGDMVREELELPVEGINFPGDKALRTFPSIVKVSYYVPEKKRKNINTEEFKVTVRYAEIKDNNTGHYTLHLNNPPDGITGVHIDPSEVSFLIENLDNSETPVSKKIR